MKNDADHPTPLLSPQLSFAFPHVSFCVYRFSSLSLSLSWSSRRVSPRVFVFFVLPRSIRSRSSFALMEKAGEKVSAWSWSDRQRRQFAENRGERVVSRRPPVLLAFKENDTLAVRHRAGLFTRVSHARPKAIASDIAGLQCVRYVLPLCFLVSIWLVI